MRLLVRKKIFAANHDSNGGETLYGLTRSSRWLLRDSEPSLAPMVLMENHPWLVAPWHCFSHCVKEGGIAFKMAHGQEIWDFALQNPELNKLFNDGMACTSRIISRAIVSGYKDGFSSIGSLVDVGGGIGEMMSEIMKSYPHIKGINFDLPHVISTAPKYNGISHVHGDMFQAVPQADAVIMKLPSINTRDRRKIPARLDTPSRPQADAVIMKILKNCKKAIPKKTGKVIIVEVVLQPDSNELFDETGLALDLAILAHTTGKERTEPEWKKILEEGGFPRYNIIDIPAFPSIIEAFHE
ncbi:hypothetical protein Pint_35615 [Pistacia integerrima]|uniref:Uncharacterized protein n=1 Tax=Pistacia integerrima TaxID=434235 RepID=A0ACC0Y3I7_9ROSI|nr:hypothetical protein Pint_35615 [Pistacia integerrima]